MLEELAVEIGGLVACLQAMVEAGLMPYERQVGRTGKTVAPKLYLGIGICRAVQHLVGIQGSEKIIAINADPKLPIFNVADVGCHQSFVVPLLIEQLKERMQGN